MTSTVNAGLKMPEGMGWRAAVSLVGFFGGIIALILCLFFSAGNFHMHQNITVIAVIFLVFMAIMGATWTP